MAVIKRGKKKMGRALRSLQAIHGKSFGRLGTSFDKSGLSDHQMTGDNAIRANQGQHPGEQKTAKKTELTSLQALTAAALVLPGLFSQTSYAAEGDEVDFQYSHYQEGKRDIVGFDANSSTIKGTKSFDPIEVDSLFGHGNFTLTDRVKFAFNYTQDTWAGATPVSTAPAELGLNNLLFNQSASGQDTITGASPYITDIQNFVAVDKNYNIIGFDPNTFEPVQNDSLTHVMATASPETRKQGDFKLTYEWDEAAVSAGGGVSVEDDYESSFGNLGGRWDLNNKRTTLNLDLSYTNSDTDATIDHDMYPYIAQDSYFYNHVANFRNPEQAKTISGTRQDWGTHFGVTQVLTKDALVAADVSYTRSTGYMANPYKVTEVLYVDPAEFQFSDFAFPNLDAFLERRPEVRNQWGLGGRYVQYVDALNAAFHFDYRFSTDDWSIESHTFEADWVQPLGWGWTVTPRIRYYSQDEADFYAPYLLVKEAKQVEIINGQPTNVTNLPSNFSSDQRLSGYGALSGGVTVSKQFAKGIALETGFEYYTHQGSLKIGGGGEGSYSDFDYWVANAALKVNLDALSMGGGSHNHHDHEHHQGAHAPAGVMFDHMLSKTGDFMVGYRYMWNSQSGPMLHGTGAVSDPAIVANGCGGDPCYLTADSMTMSMHMLDLMYAPTDWLTLMLMPQFVDMDMDMRGLNGAPDLGAVNAQLANHLTHHEQNGHETGGIGDLGMFALFKLFDNGTHHVHVTTGFSAPTGDVDIKLRRNHQIDGGFIDYGMQLGSGTWDFKPSMTYTGHVDGWSWGAQANGVVRMEGSNESGYRLGDLFQATAWGGYNLTNWLSASVRGIYTVQGSINGQYTGSSGQFFDTEAPDGAQPYSSILKFGPIDYPQNYGGRYWDIGFGLSAVVPSGDLAGNRVSVEWLQPVEDDVNGYQLERDGMLSATWGVAF